MIAEHSMVGLSRRLKSAIPIPLKAAGLRLLGQLRGAVATSSFHCPVCATKVAAFIPLATAMPALQQELEDAGYELFDAAETLNRDAYLCPVCACSDRDRLYALWIERWLTQSKSSAPAKLVDFAPSSGLSRFLRQRFEYRSADLFSPRADDQIDLQDMAAYADGRFDAFVCSHVLEHVADDRKAMRELHRILAVGGWGIAMVPINSRASETDEETEPSSARERIRRFGQADHVRFYSARDFVQRLTEAGFRVELVKATDLVGSDPARFGLSPHSVLYIVHK
jgi:O-antigen biosynthesis protein